MGNWVGHTLVCTKKELCPSNGGVTTTLFNNPCAKVCKYFKWNKVDKYTLERTLVGGKKLLNAKYDRDVDIELIRYEM